MEVAKDESGFTLTLPKEGEWIIIQYKETESGKNITARLHYDTRKCAPCGKPEWRCACGENQENDSDTSQALASPPGKITAARCGL